MKIAFKKAFAYTIPILLGYLFLGIAFGLLASEVGLSPLKASLLSAIIYAGSLQYALIPFFLNPISFFGLIIFTVSVNIRYLFYGLTLIKPFKKSKHKLAFIQVLSDESFALMTSVKTPDDLKNDEFLLAIGLLNYSYWIIATFIGALFGNIFNFNTKGLDFVLVAMFLAIFTGNMMEINKIKPSIIGLLVSFLCLLIFGKNNFMIPAIILIVLSLIFFRKNIEGEKNEHIS